MRAAAVLFAAFLERGEHLVAGAGRLTAAHQRTPLHASREHNASTAPSDSSGCICRRAHGPRGHASSPHHEAGHHHQECARGRSGLRADRISHRAERPHRDSPRHLRPGEIRRVQRPGRVKGRAELQMSFTSMIFPNGYTILLPGAVQGTPGDPGDAWGQRQEGTIEGDSSKGRMSARSSAPPFLERVSAPSRRRR